MKLKLPRSLETDPGREKIEEALARDLKPLWERGALQVPHVPFGAAFEDALVAALGEEQLQRGLEHIERVLAAEEKGLAAVREKKGTATAYRVSRLLVIPDGGVERFYRSCESILLRYGDRVLGLRVDVSCARLAQNLFGADKLVKVLLISDREAATKVLLALANE